ncbi:YncE family protein [Providencia burhodogranariea]|uniref:Low-density lipoprotein receptor YWTD repeat n=1 Tax=Providencia burhodogranariea DSM 19968 TaxID=1141662 RepID=K8X523_9GAMM|nr:low-density lipoprotein receptor YWTD repeat [Providencia burhodogranariea DSM 19968]
MAKNSTLSQPYLLLLDVINPAITRFSKVSGQVVNLIEGLGGRPDGIAVDSVNRLIYWSNMGENKEGNYDANDGSINVMNFDGTDRKVLIGQGKVRTGKQLQLDQNAQRLYWCDREGGKVASCKTDGTDLQLHIERPRDNLDKVDILEQCVGITLDGANNWFYWTQKGTSKGNLGRLFRAPLVPKNHQNPANRTDIQLLLEKLPEPIDLLLDEEEQILYWTDRGGEPDGNSLNRAEITVDGVINYRVICRGFHEAIGLIYDKPAQLMYVTDLSGGVYKVALATGEVEKIYQGKGYTGITQYYG